MSDSRALFFSGGTALNSIISHLKGSLSDITYVLPISDNGGSTAEIVRVTGGPAIGDIRSRLIRLADETTEENRAVQALLQYRLSACAGVGVPHPKHEWLDIVDGSHVLWKGISETYKETIRMFLVHFNTEVMRSQHNHGEMRKLKPFDWSNGSVGNFFFSGARMFFNSLETAIFWFSRVSEIPRKTFIAPAISSNKEINIGAELTDGTCILGQNTISHPGRFTNPNDIQNGGNIVDKEDEGAPLQSPIKRIFYLNEDGHEIFLSANPEVIKKLREERAIVYSMGSLYTSIVPCLILNGVGEAIQENRCNKILVLNGYPDRETLGMKGADYVTAIVNALNRGQTKKALKNGVKDYLTHVIYARDSEISIEKEKFQQWGVHMVEWSTRESFLRKVAASLECLILSRTTREQAMGKNSFIQKLLSNKKSRSNETSPIASPIVSPTTSPIVKRKFMRPVEGAESPTRPSMDTTTERTIRRSSNPTPPLHSDTQLVEFQNICTHFIIICLILAALSAGFELTNTPMLLSSFVF
ncbi:maternal effect embryo arrest 18 protein [Planoprotostelium fungivorum]|uniref:Maternal effect embryo arrest 18 protein n=1 Tax=Planoprotostelium fungivorum TaxID=1890364 RepID=A0A2P6MVK6_9EUKA|nr:maternal effect embryo arrest 18 protein [Planoprotostelium fungivorum]